MPTAQETYLEMMRTQIVPRLRQLGFKGPGQNYAMSSADYWAMLGFQKSAYSDADEVRFTINVLVVSRAAWEAERANRSYLRERPTANTGWGDFVWQPRIGQLVPGSQDLWWTVRAGANTTELSEAVLWAITDYAIPAMRQQMTNDDRGSGDI